LIIAIIIATICGPELFLINIRARWKSSSHYLVFFYRGRDNAEFAGSTEIWLVSTRMKMPMTSQNAQRMQSF